MERNVIFCFTGTGNSLKVSKDIAASLENCSVCHMGSANTGFDVYGYKRIGFVFPVYFLGLPLQVKNFIEGLKITADFDGYFFGIGTYGLLHGNAVRQVDSLLQKQGQNLKFATNIKMADNAIVFYDSKPNLNKLFISYKRDMAKIVPKICTRQTNRIGRTLRLVDMYHNSQITWMAIRDTGFKVLNTCNKCGICSEVCPAKNIRLENGKPKFCRRCEQCMACIQLCPQKAIDYKGKCARRNRYKHPEISINEIMKLHKAGLAFSTNE